MSISSDFLYFAPSHGRIHRAPLTRDKFNGTMAAD